MTDTMSYSNVAITTEEQNKMIKYLVHTTTSKMDTYGNRYHFARVTSVKTGKSLFIKNVGGDTNAPIKVMRLTRLDTSAVYITQSEYVPKREFNHTLKVNGEDAVSEHELTKEMLHLLDI